MARTLAINARRRSRGRRKEKQVLHTIGTHSRYDIKPPGSQRTRTNDLGDPETRETGVTPEENLANSRILDVSHAIFAIFALLFLLDSSLIFYPFPPVIKSCLYLYCKSPKVPKAPRVLSVFLAFFLLFFAFPELDLSIAFTWGRTESLAEKNQIYCEFWSSVAC